MVEAKPKTSTYPHPTPKKPHCCYVPWKNSCSGFSWPDYISTGVEGFSRAIYSLPVSKRKDGFPHKEKFWNY